MTSQLALIRRILFQASSFVLLAASITNLSGCEAKPPQGFDAVVATSRDGCSDLSGQYDLAALGQGTLLNEWLDIHKPEMTTLILDNATDLRRLRFKTQMDKTNFLAQANDLRTKNPADYYDWRKSTLAMLKDDISKKEDLESVRKIGPLLQQSRQMQIYKCKSGWMNVFEKAQRSEGKEKPYTRVWTLWLGRDPGGNLLLRTDISRETPGWTFWAAGGAGARVTHEGSQWHKIPKKADALVGTVLSEQDLPEVVPPKRSADCFRNARALAEHNQKLLQHLPEGVMLTKFFLLDGLPTDPCNRQTLEVGFSGGKRDARKEISRYLEDVMLVENLVLKEIQRSADQQQHFLLEYTLTLN